MQNLASPLEKIGYTPDILWENFRITPGALKKIKVLESSIYLTRRCNLKCQYCKIIKTQLPDELDIDQWIEVIDILDSLGIRFINIAGGEPTIVNGLERLIRHLNNRAMEYSIVSNSIFNDKKLKRMVDAGLRAYVASIDVIGGVDRGLHDLKKSSAGLRMLERLKTMGVPYLCANIVISGKNIDKVMEVIRYLTDRDIWVNICPIIWGKGDRWDAIDEADEGYRLRDEDKVKLEEIVKEVLQMKRDGATILPTESYLYGIPSFGIKLDWKCFSCKADPSPPRLTIDADGALMTCINVRGEVSKRYTIFDMKYEDKYQSFLEEWLKDARRCSGCYWSTMVMARERQEMLKKLKEVILNGSKG